MSSSASDMQLKDHVTRSIPQQTVLDIQAEMVKTRTLLSSVLSSSILLYGPTGSGKNHLAKRIAVAEMNVSHIQEVNAVTLFCTTTTQLSVTHAVQQVHTVFNNVKQQFRQSLDDVVAAVFFDCCDVLFFTNLQNMTTIASISSHQPQVQQFNILPHIIAQEISALEQEFGSDTNKHLVLIFSTTKPQLFPEELFEVAAVIPVFVPLPNVEERKLFLRQAFRSCQAKQTALINEESFTKLIQDEVWTQKLAELAEGSSFERMIKTVDNVASQCVIHMRKTGASLPEDKITEVAAMVFSTMRTSKRVGIVQQEQHCADFYAKSNGQVVAEPSLAPNSRKAGSDKKEKSKYEVGDIEAARGLSNLIFGGSPTKTPKTEPDDNEEFTILDEAEEEMIEEEQEDDEYPDENKRKRRFKGTTTTTSKRRKKTEPAKKRGTRDPTKRWYKDYNGALAYSILKGKLWGCRQTGVLDVRLDNEQKRTAIYDWDILWLGMKLLPDLCTTNSDQGINNLRKSLKAHEVVKRGIQEWRKTRTNKDEELKKLFGVSKVTVEAEMEKFMVQHREWTVEEEEKLMHDGRARAGIIGTSSTSVVPPPTPSAEEDNVEFAAARANEFTVETNDMQQ